MAFEFHEDNDFPLMLIEWQDSRQPVPGWRRIYEYDEVSPLTIVSVGYMIKDTDVVVLCPNLGDVDESNPQSIGCMQIPKICIVSRKKLIIKG